MPAMSYKTSNPSDVRGQEAFQAKAMLTHVQKNLSRHHLYLTFSHGLGMNTGAALHLSRAMFDYWRDFSLTTRAYYHSPDDETHASQRDLHRQTTPVHHLPAILDSPMQESGHLSCESTALPHYPSAGSIPRATCIVSAAVKSLRNAVSSHSPFDTTGPSGIPKPPLAARHTAVERSKCH